MYEFNYTAVLFLFFKKQTNYISSKYVFMYPLVQTSVTQE